MQLQIEPALCKCVDAITAGILARKGTLRTNFAGSPLHLLSYLYSVFQKRLLNTKYSCTRITRSLMSTFDTNSQSPRRVVNRVKP